MRFLLQFAAAAVVVAVVVAGGLAWSRLAPTLPGEGPAAHGFAVRGHLVKARPPGGKPVPAGKVPPGGRPGMMQNNGSGIPSLLPGDLLEAVNLGVLRDSAMLEAAVIAAVVIADASYRRLRRARRARTGQPQPGPTGPPP
ncbi:MAG TPA: hypothetical protein VMH35_18690 [Streptosporangiaceae bacterium]|nr:hypothetical protein [Streptosporangiaceae bacterium]